MESFKEKKEKAYNLGKFAEDIIAREYIGKGYTILERQWRLGKTEIDLIASKDDTLVIIEVKARNSNETEALSAVTNDKRKRMVRAADYYIRNLTGEYNYRFDIATFTGTEKDYKINIFEDAFLSTEIF